MQSFPDCFIFKGTTIENYTQICNAVPPLLAKAFGCYIIKVLTGAEINPIPWQFSSRDNHQNYRGKVDSKSEDNNFPIQLKLPF
ncbi:MAG: DNA cytosine methyltransferase [Okeania sp. SIO2C2]|nr:DNA cytosine methyltransferase [Okeania sp. SIO2C2]